MKILILGGTSEAVELANGLDERGHQVTTSLAGRTQAPRQPKGKLRVGGFGGVDGLADAIRHDKYDYLVDATHPFAAEMSAHAVAAAARVNVPLLRLERPPFMEPALAGWWRVENVTAAAEKLPHGASVLLTVGRQQLEPFIARRDCRFIVRSIEAPELDLPDNFEPVIARPPFTRNEEMALMKRLGVTHLVAKDAGGGMTSAKLEAGFMLKVQVIMISRPHLPDAETVSSVGDALAHFDQFPARKRFFFLP